MALTKVQTIGIETGITFTGITTTSSLQATTINVSGIATFGGNVSIAGTLTYEDVTDVDSVGLITARSGVNITGGGLVVTGVTTVSAGSTSIPSISPTGDTNTGIFFPSPDTIAFGEGGSEVARFDSSGRLGIGTNNPGSFDNFANQLVVGSGSGNNGITIYAGSTNLSSLSFGDGTGSSSYQGYLAYSHSTDSLGFYVNYSGSSSARMVIDSSGRLLVGTSSARANFFNSTDTALIQFEGANNNAQRYAGHIYGVAGGGGPWHIFAKHRSNSIGGTTVVIADDQVGALSFQGSDGTEFVEAARIEALVDGTPGTNDMPGRLVFSTTADGASSPTERMRLDSSGRLGLGTNNPGSLLTVKSPGGSTTFFNCENSGGTSIMRLFQTSGGSGRLIVSDSAGTDFFNVQADVGRIGIGTASPSDKLHVDSGNIRITGSNPQYIQAVGINLNLNTDNQNILFSRNGTEMARFDSSSRFLVGTTSSQCAVSTLKAVDTNSIGHFQTFAFYKGGLGQNPSNQNIIAVTLPSTYGISLTIMLNVRVTTYQNTDQGGERSATYCINLLRISANGGSASNAVQANVQQIGSDIATSVGSYSCNSLTVSVDTGSSSTGSVTAYIRISATSTSGASDTRVYMSGYSMGSPSSQPTIAAV